jgi:hypothetical protein
MKGRAVQPPLELLGDKKLKLRKRVVYVKGLIIILSITHQIILLTLTYYIAMINLINGNRTSNYAR